MIIIDKVAGLQHAVYTGRCVAVHQFLKVDGQWE